MPVHMKLERVPERQQSIHGLSRPRLNWNKVTSATFCLPKQVMSPAQVQDVGK